MSSLRIGGPIVSTGNIQPGTTENQAPEGGQNGVITLPPIIQVFWKYSFCSSYTPPKEKI
jgi:hypothetical protein